MILRCFTIFFVSVIFSSTILAGKSEKQPLLSKSEKLSKQLQVNIWNGKFWAAHPLNKISFDTKKDFLFIENTSSVYKHVKVFFYTPLVGDFRVELECEGYFRELGLVEIEGEDRVIYTPAKGFGLIEELEKSKEEEPKEEVCGTVVSVELEESTEECDTVVELGEPTKERENFTNRAIEKVILDKELGGINGDINGVEGNIALSQGILPGGCISDPRKPFSEVKRKYVIERKGKVITFYLNGQNITPQYFNTPHNAMNCYVFVGLNRGEKIAIPSWKVKVFSKEK